MEAAVTCKWIELFTCGYGKLEDLNVAQLQKR